MSLQNKFNSMLKSLTIVTENHWEDQRMSLLRNILHRLRRGLPKTDFLKNKHEDCANFDNGTCRFFRFTNVDPKESSCPHFKAKKKMEVEATDVAGTS